MCVVCVSRQGPRSTLLTDLAVEAEPRLGTGGDGDNMEVEMVSCGTDGEDRLPAMQGRCHVCLWKAFVVVFRPPPQSTLVS